jgi:phosphatidylglycerol:prolipoprotein diacylglycerol transferase
MYPQIQIGQVILGTYGLTMGLAFVCAWMLLEANLKRYNLSGRLAVPIVFLVAVSGIIGSKLFHVLEFPTTALAHPVSRLFSSNGYAWFGGFLAAIIVLWLLSRYYNIPTMLLMDVMSPSAALGYAIGRLGCLLAGDGDYGVATSLPWRMSFPKGLVPTAQYVHPTPIYECLAGLLFSYYLWRIAERGLPHGSILARYLLLTGTARFLVEFIRLNPRTILGLSNAQVASLLCVVVGLILFGYNSPALGRRTAVLTKGPTEEVP